MVKRKGVYLATLVVAVAILAGYVAAGVVLTTSTQNASGHYVNGSSTVTGLTFQATVLGTVSNPVPLGSSGTQTSPQVLQAGENDICANTCTLGDFSEQITYSFNGTAPALAGSVMINLQVTTSTAAGGNVTLFLMQHSPAVGGIIVIYWDLGTSATNLLSVTTTAQQCSGSSACP
jgi:hypothetical protein